MVKSKSFVLFVAVFFLFLVAFFMFFVWNQVLDEPGVTSECVDVNGASSYVFDACFDLRSRTIFLTSRRNLYDSFSLESFSVSYVDSFDRVVDVVDVPGKGSEKVYQLSSSKNPRNVYLDLVVSDSFSLPECQVPRRLFVKDCGLTSPSGTHLGSSDVSFSQVDLRTHLLELEVKEELWKRQCASQWQCGDWDQCFSGVQKRSCVDVADCFIPTDVPDTVRYCAHACVEQWSCSWSSCTDGVSVPSCVDVNACGTEYNRPSSVVCDLDSVCQPDISCSSWSSCVVDYNVADLVPGVELSSNLSGVSSRVCVDAAGCVDTVFQSRSCSTSVDVYTQRYVKCNKEYVDVYDKLDKGLLARIDADAGSSQVNIRLDGGDAEIFCDYCYNGVLDGDESDIDCGGSCGSCSDKNRGPVSIGSTTFFGRVFDWFRGLF